MIRVYDIAHSRAGDKGNTSNISAIAYDDTGWKILREQLTEEELVIFDILTRPSPALSTDERAEVKKVARELLTRSGCCWCSTGGRRRRRVLRCGWRLRIRSTPGCRGRTRRRCTAQSVRRCLIICMREYESYPERNVGVYGAVVSERGG